MIFQTFFKGGSLGCNHPPETYGILCISIQQGPQKIPPTFLMDYLSYGGVLIQEEKTKNQCGVSRETLPSLPDRKSFNSKEAVRCRSNPPFFRQPRFLPMA